MTEKKTIYLDGRSLTIEEVIEIAEKGDKVAFARGIIEQIRDFRNRLDKQIADHPEIKMYGTNVLHGNLKDTEVPVELLKSYQEKYIKVHNCGTGDPVQRKIVRAIMVIRLNSFARNQSGMCPETCELMIAMLNRDVTPWVLEEGSVGASGDLVPLAMIGAALIGLPQAKAYYRGRLINAGTALKKAGLSPIRLQAKEAMGLTNGSSFIAAASVFAVRDAELLLKNASIAAALSVEAVRGEQDAFSPLINEKNRPHQGQLAIAAQIRNLLRDSKRACREAQMDFFTDKNKTKIAAREIKNLLKGASKMPWEHRERTIAALEKAALFLNKRQVSAANMELEELKKYLRDVKVKTLDKTLKRLQETFGSVRVQDRYSFRAAPPVHGPLYEALNKLREVVNIEINSATDNPLFEKDGEYLQALSGANFHGQPLAAVIDYVKITLTALGLISDKRTFSLLNKRLSYGLPDDLAYDTSKADGGLMILQYAGAARAAECRVLSTPASIMSLTTSANQEDFVSMGSIGVLHLQKIIRNVRIIIAIELLSALRGIQLTRDALPENLRTLGRGTGIIYRRLTDIFKEAGPDKYLRTDMEKAGDLVESGALVNLVSDLLDTPCPVETPDE